MSKTLPEYLLKLCRAAKERVSDADPNHPDLNRGICDLLSWVDDDLMAERVWEWYEVTTYKNALMARWPESDGRCTFPVTVPWDELSGEERAALEFDTPRNYPKTPDVARALFNAVDCGDLYDGNFWDKGTEYGAARWRLLGWMIEELEKEVGNA